MNTWAQILAGLVVLAHCIAIFWPRKPLQAQLDENGLPILWTNEKEESKNVACVWWTGDQEVVTTPPTAQPVPAPVASFSNAVRPLGQAEAEQKRSVA